MPDMSLGERAQQLMSGGPVTCGLHHLEDVEVAVRARVKDHKREDFIIRS